MAVNRRPRPIPERPSPERLEKLRRLAELDRRWSAAHRDDAPFHPEGRPEGSDYNQHFLELEASGAQLDELFDETREILGLDPATGRRPGAPPVRSRRT